LQGQRRGGRWNYIVYVDCNTVYKIIKSVVDSDEQVEVSETRKKKRETRTLAAIMPNTNIVSG